MCVQVHGRVKVLLLRKGGASIDPSPASGGPHTVCLRDPARALTAHATVVFLTAPSLTSTSGVTLAGQTWDGTQSGELRGRRVETALEGRRVAGAELCFDVPMQPRSGALVTVEPVRG